MTKPTNPADGASKPTKATSSSPRKATITTSRTPAPPRNWWPSSYSTPTPPNPGTTSASVNHSPPYPTTCSQRCWRARLDLRTNPHCSRPHRHRQAPRRPDGGQTARVVIVRLRRRARRRIALTDRSQIAVRTRLVDGSSAPTAFYSEPRSRRLGPASWASRGSPSGGRRGAIGVDGQRRVPVHSAGGASSCFASRSAAAS